MPADSSVSPTLRKGSFRLAGWQVDPAANRLLRDGEAVRVEPKAMQVLEYLAEHAGEVVSRQELETAIWSGTVVGYEAVTNAVIKLRKALQDDARDARIIETISKGGYRLIAEVTPISEAADVTSKPLARKLAAILYADVAEYSRLTGEDEEGTHRRLSGSLDTLSNAIKLHGGTVVHYAGDAVLASFDTVTEALTCAVEVQHELKTKNDTMQEDQRVAFRIGINLGEVIVDRDDIYGDGVNVAARLESLAEPGGICVSESVRNAVHGKLLLGFESLGEQQMKNIAEPVRAYRVTADPGARPTARVLRNPLTAIAAVLAGVAIGVVGWFVYDRPDIEPASVEEMAFPLPDELSIAVLPFDNFSAEKNDDFIAKGLTEDIITALSKLPQFFVISRTSSFTLNDKTLSVTEIAQELGVRYILEGSIQRSGDTLRVNAQLVDALKGNHLWAENFDGKTIDLFSLQDELVRQILIELNVKLSAGDHTRVVTRGTANLDAWLLREQAMAELYKFTRESTVRTRELLQQARELDPNWGRLLGGLAFTYWWEARRGWTDDREEWIRKGMELANQAIETDPEDTLGYMQLGNLYQLQGDHERAIQLREKAVQLAPNDFQANWGLGSVLLRSGDAERAVSVFKHAERVSPRHPVSFLWAFSYAQLFAGHYQDVVETARRAVARDPNRTAPRIDLVAAYAALDSEIDAQNEAMEVLRLDPDFTVSGWKRRQVDFKDRNMVDKVAMLLVGGGLPEN